MTNSCKLALVLLGALFSIAKPTPAQQLQRLEGHVPGIVSRLTPVAPLPESTPVDLTIGLPLRNTELLSSTLHDIYDPSSSHFHQYLNPRQYTELFCPTDADYQALLNFARDNQLEVITAPPNRKFLHVRAPAGVINRVFHVTLHQYTHPTEGRLFYAPSVEPSIDSRIALSYVSGLDNYGLPGRFYNLYEKHPASRDPRHAGGSGSGGMYTGGDFRAAYAPGVLSTGKGQVVGILELDGYSESEIATYERQNGLSGVPLQNVYLGGYTGGSSNEESAGDIELAISMAPGLSKVIIYGASYTNSGVHDILNEMANPTQGEPLPYQISTSYYFFYDKNVYDALRQLATQGQAFFVASGDSGSYDETTGSGAFPPADHPLVTTVGGTELETSAPGGAWKSETAASFSGGGYSPWATTDPQGEFALPPLATGNRLYILGRLDFCSELP